MTDSSEALLSGRKPPFRLLVRAVHAQGKPINIRHAVSEGCVLHECPLNACTSTLVHQLLYINTCSFL